MLRLFDAPFAHNQLEARQNLLPAMRTRCLGCLTLEEIGTFTQPPARGAMTFHFKHLARRLLLATRMLGGQDCEGRPVKVPANQLVT